MFFFSFFRAQQPLLRARAATAPLSLAMLIYSLQAPRSKFHEHGRLLPQQICLLLIPFCGLRLQLKVEFPKQPCNKEPHLKIGETTLLSVWPNDKSPEKEGQVNMAQFGHGKKTYFLPRQFLGPTWNGCTASFLSPSYPVLPGSQRSGINLSGFVKLLREWYIDH